MQEKTLAILFGGIGGFSVGAARARVEYGGQVYKYKLLVSIDCDPVACHNHDLIIGTPTAKVMDLFSREQYISFHGQEPPEDWQEVTPWDLWIAFQYQVPNKVFLSPPCKGFSGLLPAKSAESEKYQALNLLTLRGLELTLKACDEYGGDVPEIIHFENVPRITSRGKNILIAISKLLKKYGYAVDMNPSHNLGEVGGLGQNRIRFQIMARQQNKVPNFIYVPPKKELRSIGDIIGPLPLPGDTDCCGWMHRLPQLQWKTWVRLALIRAGGDWRDLNALDWQNYGIAYVPRGGGSYGVQSWNQSARTITGSAKINGSSGCAAVADPRIGYKKDTHASIYRVYSFNQTGGTITGANGPTNECINIGDPRLTQRGSRHPGVYQVVKFNEASPCVTGSRFGSGAQAVADPRLSCKLRSGSYGVQDWRKASKTVTGNGDIHSGTAAVADPRIPKDTDRGVWVIIAEDGTWHRPLTTYELAMLQSFPTQLPDGRPFQLEKCSEAKAREYIGNAYPPDAAEATCMSTLMALAKAEAKVGFELSNEIIWVVPKTQNDNQNPVGSNKGGMS